MALEWRLRTNFERKLLSFYQFGAINESCRKRRYRVNTEPCLIGAKMIRSLAGNGDEDGVSLF